MFSCQDSDCAEQVIKLEKEIAQIKKVDEFEITNSTSEAKKREETIERYDNGNKKLVVTYIGTGSQEQVIRKVSYYVTGKIKEEENYKLNKLSGPYFEYYRNGQISVKCLYIDGQRDGVYTEYYFDGTIWETGRFLKGDYNGEYNTYFADGKIKSTEIYLNGDRIEATWYNSKGEVEFTN